MELVPIVEITLGIFAGLLALALAVSYVSARLKRKTQNDFNEGNHAKIINLNGSASQAPIIIQSGVPNFETRPVYHPVESAASQQLWESSPAVRKTPGKFTVLNNNIYDNRNETVSQPQQKEKKNYRSGSGTGAVAMFK